MIAALHVRVASLPTAALQTVVCCWWSDIWRRCIGWLQDVNERTRNQYIFDEFETADLNHDGVISIDEFYFYFYRELCFKFPILRSGVNPGEEGERLRSRPELTRHSSKSMAACFATMNIFHPPPPPRLLQKLH